MPLCGARAPLPSRPRAVPPAVRRRGRRASAGPRSRGAARRAHENNPHRTNPHKFVRQTLRVSPPSATAISTRSHGHAHHPRQPPSKIIRSVVLVTRREDARISLSLFLCVLARARAPPRQRHCPPYTSNHRLTRGHTALCARHRRSHRPMPHHQSRLTSAATTHPTIISSSPAAAAPTAVRAARDPQ